MSDKITRLKEKFRLALTSTAKVISDDFELINKTSEEKKNKDLNSIEINDLTNPSDFIKLRAETDSAALKKKFSNDQIYRKNLPLNNSSRSLYNIAEKIRYEALGGKMLKGIEKNFQENYSYIINSKRKDQLKTKEDIKLSLLGLWFRIQDKTERIKTLLMRDDGNSVQDEPVVDSYNDISVYGIMAQVVSRGKWAK